MIDYLIELGLLAIGIISQMSHAAPLFPSVSNLKDVSSSVLFYDT